MLELRLPRQSTIPHNLPMLRQLFALTVASMGLINGLTILLPTRPGRLALLTILVNLLAPFAPSIWPFVSAGRTLSLILGFFLLLIAYGLARGKQRAWQFAVVLLPLSALVHMTKGLDIEEAVFAMAIWLGLLYTKACFSIKSDPWHVRQGILFLAIGFFLLLLYSLSGFYILQSEIQLPGTFGGFIRSLLLRILNFPAEELTPLTRHAAWFLNSIPWLSATTLLVGMFFLLRPVSVRWWTALQRERIAHMRRQAIELVRRYGGQTLAFFALSPDNLCHLEHGGEGMVNYRLTGNVAVALGDPVCAPESFERVTTGFLNLCAMHDWRAAFYQVHPEHLPAYRALGLPALKIGEEAILNPQTFTLTGSAMANVRTSCRRAEREGVMVSWYEGVAPKEVIHELEELSSAWLERKGGKHTTEMGFSMGRLDELIDAGTRADMVAEHMVSHDGFLVVIPRMITGVARNKAGKACAFVTFTPIYGSLDGQRGRDDHVQRIGWGWALDLMRRSSDAPPGVIELLIVRAIERFKMYGAQVVSLGMVALADTRQEMMPAQRQVAGFVMDHLHMLEAHRSLFRFKQKFQPCWESRYVVASSALALPRIALAILRVHQS